MNVSGNFSNILALAQAASSTPPITEDSAALAFARKYAGQFLYDHDAGAWFNWSGHHWQRERTRQGNRQPSQWSGRNARP